MRALGFGTWQQPFPSPKDLGRTFFTSPRGPPHSHFRTWTWERQDPGPRRGSRLKLGDRGAPAHRLGPTAHREVAMRFERKSITPLLVPSAVSDHSCSLHSHRTHMQAAPCQPQASRCASASANTCAHALTRTTGPTLNLRRMICFVRNMRASSLPMRRAFVT